MVERRCQHVTKIPIYIKSIGGISIDRSEWENKNGAFFRYDLKQCPYITDVGKKYCPRHELEQSVDRQP